MKKNHWGYYALGLVTVFAVVNCGGKDKLTEEQKAQFKAVVQSTGRAAQGTMSARNAGAAGVSSLLSATGATTDAEAEKIAQYIRGKKCDFTMSPDPSAPSTTTTSSSNPLGIEKFRFTAGGAECPVAANFSLDVNMSGSEAAGRMEISFAFDFSFEVKDAELKKLNDVSKFALKGSINMKGDQGGAEINGSWNGEIVSAQYGNIGLSGEVKGSGDSGGADIEGTFVTKFPSHEVELKLESDGKNHKFFLNGEPQTQEQLAELFKSAPGIPGSTPGAASQYNYPGEAAAVGGLFNLLKIGQ